MAQYAVKRWKTCKTLIIDEISMLGGDTFDLLDAVAKAARNTSDAFGAQVTPQSIFVTS
jgi:hypothetical protein